MWEGKPLDLLVVTLHALKRSVIIEVSRPAIFASYGLGKMMSKYKPSTNSRVPEEADWLRVGSQDSRFALARTLPGANEGAKGTQIPHILNE